MSSSGDDPGLGAAENTSGVSVLRGGVWNALGNFVPQASLLVISVAAARFLGPSRFGRQSFIAFVETSAITLSTAGIPLALARFVGELAGQARTGSVRALISAAWRVEIGAAAVGAALVVSIGLLGAEPRAAWILAGIVVFVAVVQRVPTALLTGLQSWRAPSLVSVVIAIGLAAATVGVLGAGGGITGMFAVEVGATVASFVWLARIARRAEARLPPREPIRRETQRAVVQYALLSSVGVLVTLVVWRRSEFFFLDRFASDTQIALYSVAFAAVAALLLVPQAVVAAALPAVATLYGAGAMGRIRTGAARALRLLVVVTVPITALSIALGPLAVRLVYGDSFRRAGPVVIVLLAPLPLIALTNLFSVVLAGLNRIKLPLIAGVVGAAVNIGLDVLLIPRYHAVGAAFANVGGQLAAGVPVFVYAVTILRPLPWAARPLLNTVVAAAAGGASSGLVSATLDGATGLIAGIAVGAAAFAALAVALPILDAEDATWIDHVAGNRLGGVVGGVARLWSPRSTES